MFLNLTRFHTDLNVRLDSMFDGGSSWFLHSGPLFAERRPTCWDHFWNETFIFPPGFPWCISQQRAVNMFPAYSLFLCSDWTVTHCAVSGSSVHWPTYTTRALYLYMNNSYSICSLCVCVCVWLALIQGEINEQGGFTHSVNIQFLGL